jgi:type III restriction enzyme
MGSGTKPISPMVVEIDRENNKKDIDSLDIEIPVMTARIQREFKNINNLDVSSFNNKKMRVILFSEQEKREIVFKDVVEEVVHHTTTLKGDIDPEYQNVVGFFAQAIMREMRLFGCYDILFGKVKVFIENYMFESKVELTDLNILRNLSEIENVKLIKDVFKVAINELTIVDKGDTEIKNYIKISDAKPFIVNDKGFLIPKKSVFNRIVGDSIFELEFSAFLEKCDDIISFAKNFQNKEASALRIEYKNAEGFLANYYPDFFVKLENNLVIIVETKGREEENDLLKFERLLNWCEDVNARQTRVKYKALYVKQEIFEENKVRNFSQLIRVFQ